MAFRGEREALRFQVSQLEREVAEHTKELEEHVAAAAGVDAEIASDVRLLHGRGRVILALPALIALGAVAAIVLASQGSSDAEVVFGDVRAVTGTAPVPQGTRCTAFVTPMDSDDSKYDTDVEVLCGERLVYGGETLGGVDCEKTNGRAVLCVDSDATAEGGDPKLRFDRNAGSIVVEDRAPDYRIEIGLAPLPMRLE